jgi:hypothetical protein
MSDSIDTARRMLTNLAGRLKTDHPGLQRVFLKGWMRPLTVINLKLPKTLRQSLQTNVIESAFSIAEDIARNVKRWRSGSIVLRWMAQDLPEGGGGVM